MRTKRLLASLAALVLLVPGLVGVHAANPTDHDGGTEGDAGDTRSDAQAIAPGAVEGRLTVGADTEDWYALDADRGDELTVSLEAEGEGWLSATVHGPHGEIRFLAFDEATSSWVLPETGTWALQVHLPDGGTSSLGQAEPVRAYRLDVGLEELGAVEVHDLQGSGIAFEANHTEAAGMAYTVQLRLTSPATDPAALASYTRTAPDTNEQEGFGIETFLHLATDGTGDSLRLEREPAPEIDVQIESQTLPGGDQQITLTSTASYEEFLGALRKVHYAVGGDVEGFLAIAAPGTTAQAPVDTVTWGEDSAQTDKLLVPGVSHVGERGTSLKIDEPFYGAFSVDDGEGWAEDPEDHRHEEPHVMLEPAQGEWAFHVDPTVGGGPEAQHLDLDGAFAPELGLVPETLGPIVSFTLLVGQDTPLVPG